MKTRETEPYYTTTHSEHSWLSLVMLNIQYMRASHAAWSIRYICSDVCLSVSVCLCLCVQKKRKTTDQKSTKLDGNICVYGAHERDRISVTFDTTLALRKKLPACSLKISGQILAHFYNNRITVSIFDLDVWPWALKLMAGFVLLQDLV